MNDPRQGPPVGDPSDVVASEETERAVLASCLVDSSLLPSVQASLEEGDFFDPRHRYIFRAMEEVGESLDIRTLQDQLEKEGALQSVGGVAYLASLDLDLPDLTNLSSYIDIVLEKSRLRSLRAAGAKLANSESVDRATEYLRSIWKEDAGTEDGVRNAGNFADEVLETAEEGVEPGLTTPLPGLDSVMRGLGRGQLILIAGRPGMGKSSLARQLSLWSALELGVGSLTVSYEMSGRELAARDLCVMTGVPFDRLSTGRMSQREWKRVFQATRRLRNSDCYVDDSQPTLAKLAARAESMVSSEKVGLLVVDYCQLVPGVKADNQNLAVGKISRGLKLLSLRLDIPVVLLSQLNRKAGEGTKPRLIHLRDSGSLEQDADKVLFVHRQDEYRDGPPDHKADLILAKHRNGPCEEVPATWCPSRFSFVGHVNQLHAGR